MPVTPDTTRETSFWKSDPKSRVAGIDEAGRGCLAGPVVAAAVVFPSSHQPIPGIRDSKTLTPSARIHLATQIKSKALVFAVSFISVSHINSHNILASSLTAMSRALHQLGPLDHALVDGLFSPPSTLLVPSQITSITHGDSKCYSIAAASILAKVARDEYMVNLHRQYPHYGWLYNKGYGTATHRQAILDHGPTPHHRKQFLRKLFSSSPV